MSIIGYLKRLFVVHKCVSCREILDYKSFDSAVCRDCRMAFEVARTQSCPDCFRAACECLCQPKMLSKEGSLCLRKLFFYRANNDGEAQNKLIYFLKRSPNRRGFDFCAEQLCSMIEQELCALGLKSFSDQAFIVNVPRSKKSVKQYGFDQSLEICKAISKKSGIPCVNAISRRYGGKEQKKLNATQRKKNIEGRMYPNDKAICLTKGRYAILLDDVVTTGASMSACIKILRKMQVNGVICVCLASDHKNKGTR